MGRAFPDVVATGNLYPEQLWATACEAVKLMWHRISACTTWLLWASGLSRQGAMQSALWLILVRVEEN